MRSLIRKRDLQDRRIHFRKSSGTIGSFSAGIRGERNNTENILSPVYIGLQTASSIVLLVSSSFYSRFIRSLDVCLIATCRPDFYYLAKLPRECPEKGVSRWFLLRKSRRRGAFERGRQYCRLHVKPRRTLINYPSPISHASLTRDVTEYLAVYCCAISLLSYEAINGNGRAEKHRDECSLTLRLISPSPWLQL